MSNPRISDSQCRTIREAAINFIKAKKSGGIIRETVLLERLALLERILYLTFPEKNKILHFFSHIFIFCSHFLCLCKAVDTEVESGSKLSGKFQRFNAIDESIEILKNS